LTGASNGRRNTLLKVTKIDRARAGEDPTHDPYIDRQHDFAGDVQVQSLVSPEESVEVELLAVFFAAGGAHAAAYPRARSDPALP
jgi:hypothetical protein